MTNSKDDTGIELVYCTVHNFGTVSSNSQRQKEHITSSKEKCKFVTYNPKKHNPKYDHSEIQPYDDSEEKLTPTQKVLNFAESKIIRTVRSFNSHSSVYAIIKINENYRVLFLGSTECRQWLLSEYRKYSGKVHGKDLYKNVLSVIIAESITNQITIEKINNRICFVDDEIFYNLCNDDYEIVKINKNGYSIIQNSLENPLFRRKSNPLPQVKPLYNKKHKNPLNELVELLRIPIENRQLFIIHLIAFFFEKIPIPIMIFQGEAGSAKSTITGTVKKIIDPSPENRNSMPDNIDDANIHFFNRYLTNFDNISYIENIMSDNMCKAITGFTHNKRELYSDDGEIILTIKARIILNGITPNVDQTDLIDRSIFYESRHIPKNEKITEQEFDKKLDSLLPYIQNQIFTILSKTLKNYSSMELEIKEKERMADFTVIGECISRELGYDKFSFIESYKKNLSLHSFNAVESYPIVNIILDITREQGKDFEISIYDLYKKITSHAYENGINTKSKYSKFPQSEKAVTNQITRLQSTFRNLGIEITSSRYGPRDKKFKRGTRIFRIKSIDTNKLNGKSTSILDNFKVIDPCVSVSVCQEPKQAQNHSKTDTISENRNCVSVSDENATNQTKSKQKNTTDTALTQKNKKRTVSKKSKSVPKNTTDTVTQLTQPKTDLEEIVKKTKSNKNTKRYSHFKCAKCHFKRPIRINSKSRVSDETLHDIHKKAHPDHKLQYSNEDETL